MKLKRSTIIPLVLLAYLAVMAYIGYPEYASGRSSATYYYGIIVVDLVVVLLLHIFLKRRETLRARRLAEQGRSQQR